MSLMRAGFYRELVHGDPDGPSLRMAAGRSVPDLARIAAYLDGAPTLAATGSLVDDVLVAGRPGVAPLEIATDGVWVWPRDLGYYVRVHAVSLPEAFVRHMRDRQWTPPVLSVDELVAAEMSFMLSS